MTTYPGGNYVQGALATYQPAPITRVLPSSILAQTIHPHFASTNRDQPIGRLFSTLGHVAIASVALVETVVFSLFALLTAPSYLVTTKIWNFAVLHTLASFRTLKMAGNGIIHRKMTPPPPPFFAAYMTKIVQIEKKILTHKSTPIVLGILTIVALAYQSEVAPVKTSIDWAMRVCFPRKHSMLNFFKDRPPIAFLTFCAASTFLYTMCQKTNKCVKGCMDTCTLPDEFKTACESVKNMLYAGMLCITQVITNLSKLLGCIFNNLLWAMQNKQTIKDKISNTLNNIWEILNKISNSWCFKQILACCWKSVTCFWKSVTRLINEKDRKKTISNIIKCFQDCETYISKITNDITTTFKFCCCCCPRYSPQLKKQN